MGGGKGVPRMVHYIKYPSWVFNGLFPLRSVGCRRKYDGSSLEQNLWVTGLPSHFFRLKQQLIKLLVYCEDHFTHFMHSLQFTYMYFVYSLCHLLRMREIRTYNWSAPNVSRLHSSVGRAMHRYRGGHGFESRFPC